MYMAHSQYPGNPIAHTKSKKKTGGAPLDRGPTGGDRLVGISDSIVRYVAEVEKPNHERLEEFRDSNLESLRHRLLSPAPIYPGLDSFEDSRIGMNRVCIEVGRPQKLFY